MYIDVKETIEKHSPVRLKEACGDALSMKPILSLKKSWSKVVCNNWRPVGDVRLSYPTFFIDDSDAESYTEE